MKIIKLRIDGQFFYLESDQNVPALKRELVAAVTTGARFVDFTAIGHGEISVLMTPVLGARFEVQDRTEEQVAEWEENPPVIDFEAYGHE
jgi:hypothetical protein